MIPTKYLIVIGIILSLVVIYYFFNEIKNVKKLLTPAYQKTMTLESKIMNLEEKMSKKVIRNDSPALSITYQSDMIKNATGTASVKYGPLSDSEVQRAFSKIKKHREERKSDSSQMQNFNEPYVNRLVINPPKISTGKISDFGSTTDKSSLFTDKESSENKSDTFAFDLNKVVNKSNQKLVKANKHEYLSILDNLENMQETEDIGGLDINEKVIKQLSENVSRVNLSSDNSSSGVKQKVVEVSKKAQK